MSHSASANDFLFVFACGARAGWCRCGFADSSAFDVGGGNRAALEDGEVEKFAQGALTYLREVEVQCGVRICRIAIDAPRAPRREDHPRRAAEVAMDALGISCIGTPSGAEFTALLRRGIEHLLRGSPESRLPGANQLWMRAGFRLFEVLGAEFKCLEVFPQATAVTLGAAGVHKAMPHGLAAQLAAVCGETGWRDDSGDPPLDDICFGSRDDKLDAYLSAWVASLSKEERIADGDPPHDAIWIPRLGERATAAGVLHFSLDDLFAPAGLKCSDILGA